MRKKKKTHHASDLFRHILEYIRVHICVRLESTSVSAERVILFLFFFFKLSFFNSLLFPGKFHLPSCSFRRVIEAFKIRLIRFGFFFFQRDVVRTQRPPKYSCRNHARVRADRPRPDLRRSPALRRRPLHREIFSRYYHHRF